MKFYSITQHSFELEAFEIEISLMPGLPQISILGQADALVKESIPKIQSAIKSQGFRLPKAQHILVDLKPQYFKKSNRGLELAIAVAILQETGQIQLKSKSQKPWLIVGNLSLKGEVIKAYNQLDEFADLNKFEILVGPQTEMSQPHLEVETLRELLLPKWIEAKIETFKAIQKASLPKLKFSKSAARLIQILALGEHPCLIAGSVGSGKSTVVSNAAKLLEPASQSDLEQIQKVQKYFKQNRFESFNGRPEINAHHSISTIAFLGGGVKLHPGEITRAHKGTLVMDEFLEFHREIQEALREPLENAKLSIARNGHFKEFPADILLLATTNLCHCGQFSMNSKKKCRCTQAKLKNYLSRISGPCIDRFQVLAFSSCWENQKKEIEMESINDEIRGCIEFRIAQRSQKIPNSKLSNEELLMSMEQKFINEYFKIDFMSERRQLALKRVARSIADLGLSERVRIHHLKEAFSLTVSPFLWLEQAQMALAPI